MLVDKYYFLASVFDYRFSVCIWLFVTLFAQKTVIFISISKTRKRSRSSQPLPRVDWHQFHDVKTTSTRILVPTARFLFSGLCALISFWAFLNVWLLLASLMCVWHASWSMLRVRVFIFCSFSWVSCCGKPKAQWAFLPKRLGRTTWSSNSSRNWFCLVGSTPGPGKRLHSEAVAGWFHRAFGPSGFSGSTGTRFSLPDLVGWRLGWFHRAFRARLGHWFFWSHGFT